MRERFLGIRNVPADAILVIRRAAGDGDLQFVQLAMSDYQT